MCAPVDVARLEEFSDGTASGLRMLIRLFLADAAMTIGQLIAAVDQADSAAVRLLAHRVGGSSAICGAETLARLLFALESQPAGPTPADNVQRLRAVEREFQAVTVFLDRYLTGTHHDEQDSDH